MLTPEGLAQPAAPGVPTAFLGAGAGPPPAAVQPTSGPFVVPLKMSLFGSPCFEPIFSAACPLPKEELDLVVGRLSTALAKKATPNHWRIVPYLLIAGGVLTCIFGVMRFNFVLMGVGMLLFAVGGFAKVRAFPLRGGGNALIALRRELSELNAQYNPRGIDFHMIEWGEFVSTAGLPNTGYGPQIAGYGPQMAGYGPQVAGYGPQVAGYGPQVAGYGPQVAGYGPQVAGCGPQVAGYGPQVVVPVREVWKHALLIRALQPEQPGFPPSDPQ